MKRHGFAVKHDATSASVAIPVEARGQDLKAAGLSYETNLLIDDAVARSVRHPGGFLWACMNYEGDLMSDGIE